MSFYIMGLDLGQASDYTGISITERVQPEDAETGCVYHLRHLERVPLKTPYPVIGDYVKTMLSAEALAGSAQCVVDATGVGRPVVDMLREKGIYGLAAVTITGGDVVVREGTEFRVPKRDLVSAIQVLLQNRRLKFADKLPHREILIAELQNFRVKINLKTGHDSYEAWRDGEHDDLVLSVALACWYAEQGAQWWMS